MPHSFKGAIQFGLIYIPITLNVAVKSNNISFHMLEKKTKSRIKYKKTCVDCNEKEVKQNDIVKGYEYEDEKYVIFDDKDFEKLKSKKDKNITIEQFINIKEIDPIYFEKSYYVVPTGAENAFALLLKAMEDDKKVGIAKAVMNNKETLIAIRVKSGQMMLNTLYYNDEVQTNPAKNFNKKFKKEELDMAKILIKSMTKPFNIEEYQDTYTERVKKAIESKVAGKEIIAPKDTPTHKVKDLMEALELSLKQNKTTPKPQIKKTTKKAKAK